jgi:hypothetical protein
MRASAIQQSFAETNYAKDNQAFSRAYLFNFLPRHRLSASTPTT